MNIERLEKLIIQNMEIAKQLSFLILEEKKRIKDKSDIISQLTPIDNEEQKEENEPKAEPQKKPRKPRTTIKKTISIIDDSNDEPLTITV